MREFYKSPVEKHEAVDMRGSSLLPGLNSRPVFSNRSLVSRLLDSFEFLLVVVWMRRNTCEGSIR